MTYYIRKCSEDTILRFWRAKKESFRIGAESEYFQNRGLLKEARDSPETIVIVYQTCSDLLPPFVLPTKILSQGILSPVSLG